MHTEPVTSIIHVVTDTVLGRTVLVVPGQTSAEDKNGLKRPFGAGPRQMPSEHHVHTGHVAAALQTRSHGPAHVLEGKVGWPPARTPRARVLLWCDGEAFRGDSVGKTAVGAFFSAAGRSVTERTFSCFLHAFYSVFRHCFSHTRHSNTPSMVLGQHSPSAG